MSVRVELTMDGLSVEEVSLLAGALANPAPLHAKIAGDAERFVKTRGPAIAAGQHRTATTLGATPTGHLEDAYQAIEGQSDGTSAVLLVPRASRLRAAFGPYTLRPTKSQYLTIPVSREAYGRRARELDGLFPVRVGPRKTLVLARRSEDGRGIETMFVLVKEANIREDETLFPFQELAEEARDSAEEFLDELIGEALT